MAILRFKPLHFWIPREYPFFSQISHSSKLCFSVGSIHVRLSTESHSRRLFFQEQGAKEREATVTGEGVESTPWSLSELFACSFAKTSQPDSYTEIWGGSIVMGVALVIIHFCCWDFPFEIGIFHHKNHPASLGTPMAMETPVCCKDTFNNYDVLPWPDPRWADITTGGCTSVAWTYE